MNVSQIFLCIFTITLAGVISSLIAKMYWNLARAKSPYMMITLVNISVILFIVPIGYLGVSVFSLKITAGTLIRFGDFLFGDTELIEQVFEVFKVVWFAGFLVSFIGVAFQYIKLFMLMRANVPVEYEAWNEVFEETYKAKGIKKVSLCQNDTLESPIVAGIVSPKILFPYNAPYGEKELRIYFEHELNHLKSHDLFWRMLGIVVKTAHWFNPFAYISFYNMMFFQDVVADCNSTEDNRYFTMKEYVMLLADLSANKHKNVHMTAIGEPTNKLIRRIEIMINTKKLKKISKRALVLGAIAAILASVIPSTLVTAKAAQWSNEIIQATEMRSVADVSKRLEPIRLELPEDDVEEIYIDVPMTRGAFHLDTTIPAGIRAIYRIQDMYVGDEVSIMVYCEDDTQLFWTGVKNSTGSVWYNPGYGSFHNTYTITEDGTYAAFVQNKTDRPMTITGMAIYP